MSPSSFFRAFCIGATLVTVAGQSLFQNLFLPRCWTCEQSPGCFECLSKSDNEDGTSMVELDFSECKNADTIGWACCTGSSGPDSEFNRGDCEVPELGCFGRNNRVSNPEFGSFKCNRVSSMFVKVPSDATSVTINTYDVATGNDALPSVGADPMCGRREFQASRCATRHSRVTSHCLEMIDLSSCPTGDASLPSLAPSSSPTADLQASVAPTASTDEESDAPSLVPTPSATLDESDAPSVVPTSDTTMAGSDLPSAVPTSDN